MNNPLSAKEILEPERYELYVCPAGGWTLPRRDFVKLLGAGLLFTLVRPAPLHAQQRRQQGWRPWGGSETGTLDSRIHIAEEGRITILTGKVEVGQDIRTALTQLIAEELRTPPASIQLIMGDTDLVPDDGPTFGSMTIRYTAPLLAKAAAAAREYLIDLAAARWELRRTLLRARDGKVEQTTSGASLGYGELVQGHTLTRKIGEVTLTPAEKWVVAGNPLPKVNGSAVVTGTHTYPSDIKREGMLHGKVLRPPARGARRLSLNTSKARAMSGVTVVEDGDFVGLAAADPIEAQAALDAIDAHWETTPQANDRTIYDHLKKTQRAGGSGWGRRSQPSSMGSVKEGLSRAAHRLGSSYRVAYIAHVPLEPRAAVAEWREGKLTVWTGTQIPFWVRRDLAESFSIAEEKVRVMVPDTGSAYGGKHVGDAALEAARLSLKAGKPVKVVWTREEEFNWAYFRPAGVIDIRAGVAADGTLTAWEFHNYNSGSAALHSPWYRVPNVTAVFHPCDSPLRQGSYRALAATANNFARESHMDDLASLAGSDPLSFRTKNINDPRLRAVLNATAERFGWSKLKSSPNRGYGMACCVEKGGYVACCAELELGPGNRPPRVARLTQGFECGAIVNPDLLQSQIIGCMIQGLGGALFEEIKFENGTILNPRLSAYRVPRFSDVPEIDVVVLNRRDLPSAGAGETPILAVAPAIRNAFLAATGVHLYTLPLQLTAQKL